VRAIVVRPGPHFSVQDVAEGWVQGLRSQGVEVADFNFDDRFSFFANARTHPTNTEPLYDSETAAREAAKGLLAQCYSWWPDLVLVVSGFFIPPDVMDAMRARGQKVVLVHTESPYEDDRQIPRAQHADLNLLNDPTNLELFRTHAGPTVYMPHAYLPDVHHPREPEPDLASDFAFVGSGFPSRIEFFEAVDWSGIDFSLAGNWRDCADGPLDKHLVHDPCECLDNADTVRLYTSAKCSANIYRREATATADGWAMGPREVELAACGTFFLRDPRPEGDELFPMLPTFDGPGDFEEKLRWWLRHDEARELAAHAARAAVTERTFGNHAGELLRLIAA
jgi:spore maturation protein CgeB